MSFFKAMNISSTGLAAQRVRMNVLSSNLLMPTQQELQKGDLTNDRMLFSPRPQLEIPLKTF